MTYSAPARSIVDSSGKAAPTLRMSAGGAADGQTVSQFTANPSLASGYNSGTILTPAAGTTFYMTDISITANTATPFLAQVQANGVTIWQAYVKGDTGPVIVSGLETQPQCPAGQALTLVLGTAAATTAAVFLAGFAQ